MQIQSTASLAFIELSPERKIPVGEDMSNGIEAHADVFKNPPVAPASLLDTNNQLSAANAKARTSDKTAAAALLNVEKRWDADFKSTAKFVGTIANGDEEIIRMGGCTPTKNERNPMAKPDESKDVEVEALKGHGTVSVGCGADASVKAYLYYARTKGVSVRQDGDSLIFEIGGETIVIQADTHRKMIFHNLQSDVRVWVGMLPLNNAGSGPLSPEQSATPQ